MSELAELERHIQSISQTRQITNAMYLTASSKMRKAMKMYEENKTYMTNIYPVLKSLMENPKCNKDFPFIEQKEKKYAYIVITSDQGFAGSYNLEILALAKKSFKLKPPSIVYVIGNVGEEYLKKRKYKINVDLKEYFRTVTKRGARYAAQILFDEWIEKKITDVYIIYTKMESSFHYTPVVRRLLPIIKDDYEDQTAVFSSEEADFLPSLDVVVSYTLNVYLMGRIYHAMVQSYAAEHSVRMQTMETATRNADEMLNLLKKKANQARQDKITQEIIEIVSSSMVIGGDE